MGLVDGSSRDASLSFYCFKSDLCFLDRTGAVQLVQHQAKVHRGLFFYLEILDVEVIEFLRLLQVGHALNRKGIPWSAVPLSDHLLYKSLFVSYELI